MVFWSFSAWPFVNSWFYADYSTVGAISSLLASDFCSKYCFQYYIYIINFISGQSAFKIYCTNYYARDCDVAELFINLHGSIICVLGFLLLVQLWSFHFGVTIVELANLFTWWMGATNNTWESNLLWCYHLAGGFACSFLFMLSSHKELSLTSLLGHFTATQGIYTSSAYSFHLPSLQGSARWY